jgi:hypothetical protein
MSASGRPILTGDRQLVGRKRTFKHVYMGSRSKQRHKRAPATINPFHVSDGLLQSHFGEASIAEKLHFRGLCDNSDRTQEPFLAPGARDHVSGCERLWEIPDGALNLAAELWDQQFHVDDWRTPVGFELRELVLCSAEPRRMSAWR